MPKLVVQFNGRMDSILGVLADKKGTTKVDVLRRAVALYRYLSNEVKMGGRVAFTKGDDILAYINLP